MSLRSSTAALIGGTLLAAALVPAGTAAAAGVSVPDATSDVWVNTTNDGEYAATELVDNVDVESLRVRHLANRVVVTAGYIELRKAGVPLVLMNRLRFDEGPVVTMMIDTNNKWSGESVLYSKQGLVDCAGFDHTVDYAEDTVELVVPRACVDNPRWVEASYVGLGYMEDSDAESGFRNYRDNALRTDSSQGGWTDRVRRG